MFNFCLLLLFATLQAFQKYDATFLELLETSQIQDYPDLVKHMTEIFNDLSQSILAIKVSSLSCC